MKNYEATTHLPQRNCIFVHFPKPWIEVLGISTFFIKIKCKRYQGNCKTQVIMSQLEGRKGTGRKIECYV